MKTLTLDASVIIKWIFPEKDHEAYTVQALNLLDAIKNDFVNIVQPSHWLAEAMAVIVRLNPKIAEETILLLNALEFPIADTVEIYYTACELSHRYQHHLFDTLYHAVSLTNNNTQLVTADDKYYRKSFKEGAIIRLEDFSLAKL
jgi:predicted nucleic acid-binding protein